MDAPLDDDNPRFTGKLTHEQRLSLLERDSRSHARSLTAIVATLGKGFSEEQAAQLRHIMREELGDVGVRLDDPDHVDDAREDFRFLRRLRTSYDGAARKVGNLILMALFGVSAIIIGLGFWAWIGRGGSGN